MSAVTEPDMFELPPLPADALTKQRYEVKYFTSRLLIQYFFHFQYIVLLSVWGTCGSVHPEGEGLYVSVPCCTFGV